MCETLHLKQPRIFEKMNFFLILSSNKISKSTPLKTSEGPRNGIY